MISTIFMTIIYMAIAGSALAIWMSINNRIIDNMNKRACTEGGSSDSSVVDSVQSLYIWLTIVLGLSFIGIVRGIRGITDGIDVYDVDEIFSVIYIAGTIIAIFIAAFNIRFNPIIKNMSTDYTMVNSDGTVESDPIKANHTISSFLTVLTVVPSIAMIFILYTGYELIKSKKKPGKDEGKDEGKGDKKEEGTEDGMGEFINR